MDGLPVGRGDPVSAIAFASGGHESLQRRRLPGAQLMLAARNCVARRHLALFGPRCGKIVKVDTPGANYFKATDYRPRLDGWPQPGIGMGWPNWGVI